MSNTKPFRKNTPSPIKPLDLALGPVIYQPVASLWTRDRKVRRHPEKQLVKLCASISQFGFLVPVIANAAGVIVAGEARFEAARKLGLKKIPVLSISHLSDAEVRAFRIADSKLGSLATWDEEALKLEMLEILSVGEISVEALGFETAELDLLLDAPSGGHAELDPADAMPEMPSNPVTRAGDLWRLGRHRILCGTSLETSSWTRLMDGALGAMAFTDAPYNVPINGHVSGHGRARHAEFAMAVNRLGKMTLYRRPMLTPFSDGHPGCPGSP